MKKAISIIIGIIIAIIVVLCIINGMFFLICYKLLEGPGIIKPKTS